VLHFDAWLKVIAAGVSVAPSEGAKMAAPEGPRRHWPVAAKGVRSGDRALAFDAQTDLVSQFG
jgi:hypothetical protein